LFVRLKRCVYALMVLLALWAVVLAVSPAVAEAQGMARVKDAQKGAERIVVSPGDSLWSISEERLGPNATPQQIANAVERIYALNRNQIGADPNLIFPGQKLLAPPVGELSTAELSTGATRAREATEAAQASLTDRAAKSGTDQASRTAVGATDGKGEEASDPVALREVGAAAPVPAVKSLAPEDSPRSPIESFARTVRSAVVGAFPRDDYLGRKLLGLGVIVLTLIVCGLMAWKLPMRRNVGHSAAWGIPGGHPKYRVHPEALNRYADASGALPMDCGPKQSLDGSDEEATGAENDLGHVGIARSVGTRREGGAGSARRLLRKPEIVGNRHKLLGLVVNEENLPYQGIHLLTARQREVLELVAEGLPNAQIARRLFITESTVKQHLYKAYKTLGVRNRREAAKFLSSNRSGRAPAGDSRGVGL
jgi:DNA-binding CsgD family transcriptional regulator